MGKLSSYNTVSVYGTGDYIPLHNSGISNTRIFPSSLINQYLGYSSNSGKLFSNNGSSGVWIAQSSISAGGSNTQVQFNGNGSFSGSANFVYSGGRVGINTNSPATPLDVRGRLYIDRSGFADFGNSNDCFLSVGNYFGQSGSNFGEFGIGVDNNGHTHFQTYGGKDLVIQDINNKIGFFGHPNSAFYASFANTVGPSGNNTINFGSPAFIWKSGYFNYVDVVNLNVSGATTGIFPSQAGNSGKVLATNGSNVIWATSGAGGGTPGGSDTYVQFNSGGSFAGSSGFIYNHQTGRLGLGGVATPSGLLHLLPASGVSGITISIASGQISNPINIISTGNQILGGFKSDGTIIMRSTSGEVIDSTTYYTHRCSPDVYSSVNRALVIERHNTSNDYGQGVAIFLKDNGVYGGMRFWSNSFSQNANDLEFYSARGLCLRMPYNGGNNFYNPVQNSNNICALEIETQLVYPGGGSPSPQSMFRMSYPNMAATGPLTLAEAATMHISGAPIPGVNLTLNKRYAVLINGYNSGDIPLAVRVSSGAINNAIEVHNFSSGVILAVTNSGNLSVSGSGYFDYIQVKNLNVTGATTGITASATAGGTNTTIQFNSGNAFSGANNLTYDYLNRTLTISGSGGNDSLVIKNKDGTTTAYFNAKGHLYSDYVFVNTGLGGSGYLFPVAYGWSFPSGTTTGTGVNVSYEIPILYDCKLDYCQIRSKTVASGHVSGFMVDINYGSGSNTGISIWSTNQANRLAIPNNARSGSQTNFSNTGVLLKDNFLSIDIDFLPTGLYASDVVITIGTLAQKTITVV